MNTTTFTLGPIQEKISIFQIVVDKPEIQAWVDQRDNRSQLLTVVTGDQTLKRVVIRDVVSPEPFETELGQEFLTLFSEAVEQVYPSE